MNIRAQLLRDIVNRPRAVSIQKKEDFGSLTFHAAIYEKILPKPISENLNAAKQGRAKLKPSYAQNIAQAMQQWAMGLGATHFCHWFQPMTGLAAEKQDAFLEWGIQGEVIEKLTGKHLMRGEPDASSFPSGGLRSTSEARGYTTWDPTSLPFLWETGSTRVLCLPAIFFSWTGKALDMKIPLLRSEAKISHAGIRLLSFFNIEASSIHTTLGCEQEYFLIDRGFFLNRPDLIMAGRTLWGASPSKGQELEDHYFGTLKHRVAAFMTDVEHRAWALGIPLKTRHNEVAPNQFETAPLFEKISIAIDHNILLMELMRQVAEHHHLACLMHEKPFARINGSGKHCNWSLATDTGYNLLDPYAAVDNQMPFLVTLTAVLHAVYHHSALIRASIAVPGNDHRLGGHEAPPPIISVYLGHALEKMLMALERDKIHQSTGEVGLDLGIPPIPELNLDATDRNRTSPFPFTGTKFEFRAVGASQNPALPITVLNAIVADSLNQIIDRIEKEKKSPLQAALNVIQKVIHESKAICFSGDNYSTAWHKEAKKRKLPIIEKSVYALNAFLMPETCRAFEGILTKEELTSRVDIMKERYCKTMQIEMRILIEGFRTQILPAALAWQTALAESIAQIGKKKAPRQSRLLNQVTHHIELCIAQAEALEKNTPQAFSKDVDRQARFFCDRIAPLCESLRQHIDQLELLVDDRLWPSPKYSEMLHIL